ncbi:MAG: GatB/YqeY domain-containing protein [Gemmatimonadales bacterium]|jgi:uncharacterized protein YqeY
MAEGTLQERIREDMNAARRQQDKGRARLLSTVLSDIHNREIQVGHPLKDDEVVEVLARAVKMRNEAADHMASRPELAEQERAEAEALKGYMPAQLEEDEIRRIVEEAIAAAGTNIGAVMGQVMPQVKGRADGREVNRIAREVLQAKGSGG